MSEAVEQTRGAADGAREPELGGAEEPEQSGTEMEPLGNGRERRRRRGRRGSKWKQVADTKPMESIDADVYSTKKTVAQGFMDVALLSANADQLRTLVRTGDSSSPFYVVVIVFLSLSLILQVTIAICLLLKGRYNINKPEQFRRAECLNNVCMVASLVMTVLNVLTTSFMPEVPGLGGSAPATASVLRDSLQPLPTTAAPGAQMI